MIEAPPFSILVPAMLGLFAIFVWLVTLLMFKAKAQLEYSEGTITLTVKNASPTFSTGAEKRRFSG